MPYTFENKFFVKIVGTKTFKLVVTDNNQL